MTVENSGSNLPAQIADALTGIPKALIPASVKAIDRLIGAAVDIPLAWLAQKKAHIDVQTKSYALVEEAIAKAAALEVVADQVLAQQAINVLVRKEYRKLSNRGRVVEAMVEDLRDQAESSEQVEQERQPAAEFDEDWLNVFERYAEDASTERMQKLWGRVLAGEVRKPGRFSMRTLRFLSEFSQADAFLFADFCNSAFGGFSPKSLVKPTDVADITTLINLEAAGLINGAAGSGLAKTYTFNNDGCNYIVEGGLAIQIKGKAGDKIRLPACILTPLGQELILLLPARDLNAAARRVAHAIKSPQISEANLMTVKGNVGSTIEVLWSQPAHTIEIPPN